jgi:hypothetical protein
MVQAIMLDMKPPRYSESDRMHMDDFLKRIIGNRGCKPCKELYIVSPIPIPNAVPGQHREPA